MSDTPRTDAALDTVAKIRPTWLVPPIFIDHARTLERELVAEARRDSAPVAWMWQHEETGAKGFVENASKEDLDLWERMNKPRKIICPLYAAMKEPA